MRSVPTTHRGREGSCRARCATISRLSSSHQCRSSSARSVGPSSASDARRATASRTTSRRRRCASPEGGDWPVTSMRSVSSAVPRAATSGPLRARHRVPEVQEQSRRRARRPGVRPRRTTARSPARRRCSCTARSSRVLPIPASPARRTSPPRPSIASLSGRWARARISSLPCIAPERSSSTVSSVPPTSVARDLPTSSGKRPMTVAVRSRSLFCIEQNQGATHGKVHRPEPGPHWFVRRVPPVAATTTSWSSEPGAPAPRRPACWPGPATTWSWSTGPTRPATPARRTRCPAAASYSSTAGGCSTTWSPPAPPRSGPSPSTTTAGPSGTPSRTGPASTSSSRRGATCSTPCWPTPPWPPAPAWSRTPR